MLIQRDVLPKYLSRFFSGAELVMQVEVPDMKRENLETLVGVCV